MNACAPVLFLVFNRPEQTRQVFEAIRAARPEWLYVAADGVRPGRPGESERCAQVRRIATSVDWPCRVNTLLRDYNLGCAAAVSGAISWFFNNECEGIVLEDDCLPDHSFFRFASTLLKLYRDDQRIGQICGFNLLPEASPLGFDYFPSHFGWSWGWGTWRRSWETYESNMASWNRLKEQGLHLQHPFYPERIRLFDATSRDGCKDSWDYQWHYSLARQGQLSLIPSLNLVQNIGFTADATHTPIGDARRSRPASSLTIGSEEDLQHPEFLLPSPAYEKKLIRSAHAGGFRQKLISGLARRLPQYIRQRR